MSLNDSIKTNLIFDNEANPTQFFHQKIICAQKSQNIKLTENVEFYLINLLCDFLRTNQSESNEDCLALILKKALESSDNERIILYKKLADQALYFSGFFQEFFNNKSYDIKYYVSMGTSAYTELSHLMRKKSTYQATMSQIYKEMSTHFIQATDVLLYVSEDTANKEHERTTLSIYDAWQNTTSKKLHDDLIERGIIPIKTKHRKTQ